MDCYTLTVEKEEEGMRLDIFIAQTLDTLSRSAVQKLIESKHIQVSGKVVKSNYKVRASDVIELSIPEPVEASILPEELALDIVFEDKDVIVVNKPQGMVVHPAAGHYSGTLVNALMHHCAGSLSGINGIMRPGIVHRIDKDTSGVIMVAKNDNAHCSLAKQLAEHTITRKYYAVVYNKLKQEQATVDAPIGRSVADRKKMEVTQKNSRHAITHYTVLEHLGKYDFIEVRLETGRTHQIRVHMAHIGHPLLGDTVYGAKKQPFHLEGQVLHAGVLGFIHPCSAKYMEFNAPLPPYFLKLLEKLRATV